jgi:hypothetical protein
MSLNEAADFLRVCCFDPGAFWSQRGIDNVSKTRVPDVVFKNQRSILKADINQLWASWFIDSLLDPVSIDPKRYSHVSVVESVKKGIDRIAPLDTPLQERKQLLSEITQLVQNKIKNQEERARVRYDSTVKGELLDMAGTPPRCWICGYKFLNYYIDIFLDGTSYSEEPPLPDFLDYLRPHGLNTRDRRIEIDHVNPFCLGGGEEGNLRLACGYCNKYKSWKTSLYNSESNPINFLHPKTGKVTVPQPFWLVRIFAVKQRCEFIEGCEKTNLNSMLYASLAYEKGSANPLNIKITCADHDPIKYLRLVSRAHFKS